MRIAVSVLLLLLGVAVYVRHWREAGWLLLLRLAALLLLSAILLDWVLAHHWTVRPRRIAVMLDRSSSMTVGRADTLALAAARLFPVPAGTKRETWAFGDTLRRVAAFDDDAGTGVGDRRTLLGEALGRVLRTRPGAVVIVSDGRDNGELDPVRAAEDAGIPVYAVGCGRTGGRNLAAVSVTPPLEVYAGDTATVLARLWYEGVGEEEVVVRLGQGMKRVRLRSEVAEQEFSFRTVFPRPGRQLVRFSVDSVPGESDYLDNEKTVAVDVKPGRVRVAFVTNRPGPETRFVLSALKQFPWVELVELVERAPGVGGSRGPGSNARTLEPSNPRTLSADVFVLSGISEGPGDALLDDIVRRVRNGAGALLLAGPDFRPGTRMTSLLPGGSGVVSRQGSFSPELTSAGRMFSWLAGIDFGKVPPFSVLFEPQAGAEKWLVSGEQAMPVMLAYEAGAGRVVYVAGHPLWRWGFGPDIGPGRNPLELFLGGVVRYLAEQDRERFRLSSDRPMSFLGEPVRLVLSARTPDGSAWSGLFASVSADSGPAVPMIERASGVYEAELPAVAAGTHEAVAVVMLGDSVVGRAVSSFAVSEREVEMAITGLNRELLASLAHASGGEYYRWDSLPPEGFEPEMATFRRGFVFEPARSFWAYALVALLVGVELVVRRRRGLM